MIDLSPELSRDFVGQDTFARIFSMDGKVFRSVPGRRTLRFEIDGRGYFLKVHMGVGWREIVKNLLYFRLPVLGAENERRAIERLLQLGVATMTIAGYGKQGVNPARQRSFIITRELADTVSLDCFCQDWSKNPPSYVLRKILTEKLAEIARTLHSNGVNHRDFYLCHFLLQLPLPDRVKRPRDLTVYLIDLHRVQLRPVTPRRWAVKDLAGLYFSSLEVGLSVRDVLRFIRIYRGRRLKEIFQDEQAFWLQVRQRAERLYFRDFGRAPIFPV